GNKNIYKKLDKSKIKLTFFHNIKNLRSMLHIDNLSEFLRLMIKNEEQGLFFPQNEKYVCTSNMVKIIAEVHHKNIHLIKLFNPVLYMMVHYKVNIVNKVFGSLVYDQEMSRYKEDYNVNGFKESIVATER